MAQRVQITVEVGAGAPIEVIRQIIDNLDTVCQFGGELQYRVALAVAQQAVLRDPGRWIPGPRPSAWHDLKAGGGVPTGDRPSFIESGTTPLDALLSFSPDFAPAISRYLEESDSTQDTVTTVESIKYSNPLEIVLGAGIAGGIALIPVVLQMIRDWPARRRLNNAAVADIENVVAARKQLRDGLVRQMLNGNIPVSAPQINDLLTLDVARAMLSLRDTRFSMSELESGDAGSSQE
ncbi:hypothetical protein [Mycobacterium marseillense]|uniref:hypothetical protein n=1 Tax=Mycobacterium marseillense TaxID=701042 RepID=UPI000AD695A2|nr:hypothetical protein [Mycobacterium marseillense]MCA2261988.1 hypothetical protein [Mycobacterium marseillense]